jgi:molybdate transport system permease protein
MPGLTSAEWDALTLTLTVALRGVAFSLPLAIGVAWLLARGRFPGRVLLDGLVHLPLVLPPVVVGYVLLLGFGGQGPIGRWLMDTFGIRLAFSSAGASLATAVMAFPLMVRAVRLSIDAIDPGLDAAARTLGAGALDRFATVALPLMLPGIIAAGVIGLAAGFGEFGAVITFVSNIPGETQTLPLAIYSAIQQPDGDAAAARLVAISVTVALGGLLLAEALTRWATRRVRGTG